MGYGACRILRERQAGLQLGDFWRQSGLALRLLKRHTSVEVFARFQVRVDGAELLCSVRTSRVGTSIRPRSRVNAHVHTQVYCRGSAV